LEVTWSLQKPQTFKRCKKLQNSCEKEYYSPGPVHKFILFNVYFYNANFSGPSSQSEEKKELNVAILVHLKAEHHLFFIIIEVLKCIVFF